jgi:hypothetical protein
MSETNNPTNSTAYQELVQAIQDKFDEASNNLEGITGVLKSAHAKSITIEDWNSLVYFVGRLEAFFQAFAVVISRLGDLEAIFENAVQTHREAAEDAAEDAAASAAAAESAAESAAADAVAEAEESLEGYVVSAQSHAQNAKSSADAASEQADAASEQAELARTYIESFTNLAWAEDKEW